MDICVINDVKVVLCVHFVWKKTVCQIIMQIMKIINILAMALALHCDGVGQQPANYTNVHEAYKLKTVIETKPLIWDQGETKVLQILAESRHWDIMTEMTVDDVRNDH